MPIPEMNGQRVLVTGAGAGIGRGLTKSLLEMGAEVHVHNDGAFLRSGSLKYLRYLNGKRFCSRFGRYQELWQTLNLSR